jgi:hypothetical protein
MSDYIEKLLHGLSFDGTTPANIYLTSFENISSKYGRLEPDFDDFMRLEWMKQQLKNANTPSEKGVDGKVYKGPATWLTRQPAENFSSYPKLVTAIKKRYHGETETDMGKVLDAIAKIRPDWKKDSMKDYFGRIRDVNGASFPAAVIRLINGVLPSEVRQQLMHPSVNWKEMNLTEYENFFIRVWETVRHPDLSFAMKPAEGTSALRTDDSDEVVILKRRLAKMELRVEESNKFLKKYIGSDEVQRQPRRDPLWCYNC